MVFSANSISDISFSPCQAINTMTMPKPDTIKITEPSKTIQWNPNKEFSFDVTIDHNAIAKILYPNDIKDVEIIVPNKVVKVTFVDGTSQKMVCQHPDVFSLEDALYMALAKKLYKKECTFDGIEWKAKELRYYKEYEKIVKAGLKIAKQKQLAAEKEEREKQESLAIKKRRAEKRRKTREKRENKRVEEQKKEVGLILEVFKKYMNIGGCDGN